MSRDQDHPAADWWRVPREPADGERPFTDFGQFGYGQLDRRVFWQDVYWVDIAGTGRFLVDMSPEYRANVVDFLQRGAFGWWLDEIAYLTFLAASGILTGGSDEPATKVALDQPAVSTAAAPW